MANSTLFSVEDFFASLAPAKRSIFVSYHHGGDQAYYDYFARIFGATYSVIRDRSLRNEVDSDNCEYVMRRIREDYLTGTSCTVVLCGADTGKRKFVDWEIEATLDKTHGLIGVALPTAIRAQNGSVLVPGRLHDNVQSGFALFTEWNSLFQNGQPSDLLQRTVEAAVNRPSELIRNQRETMSRNG